MKRGGSSGRTARIGSMLALVALCVAPGQGCGKDSDEEKQYVAGVPATAIPGHEALQDNSAKEGPRLMHAEVYLRSLGRLFGDLTPVEVEAVARGATPGILFDRWRDYLASLGLPDHRSDVNRGVATNSLMIATFDRLAIALCIRAGERELRGAVPLAQRKVFAFDSPDGALTDGEFDERFDVLHRTFLGYPAKLAETARTPRFRALYRLATSASELSAEPLKLTPREAGWVAVCYGLARHPELHLY